MPTSDEPDADPMLTDWLRTIYASLKQRLDEPRQRQGRRFFNVAQVVAVGLLMEREGFNVRECRAVFLTRPDLCRAARFLHVPSPSWFAQARDVSDGFLARRGARAAVAAVALAVSLRLPG